MKYTIYQIEELESKKKYISAYIGTRNINEVRLSRKDLLDLIKNKKISKTIISIEKDKLSAEQKLKELNKNLDLQIFRIDKKIPVQDSLGNISKVYKDNPKYISGELFHINKGMVICKDKQGINKYIKRDIWMKGEHTGIMKNRVTVKDSSNNTFSVDKNDMNYKSGKYTFISLGTTFKKSKQKTGFKQNNYNTLRQKKLMKKYKKMYPNFNLDIRSINGKLLIEKYCEHGNLYINKNKFDTIYNINEELLYCDKCKERELLEKEFSINEINNLRNKFKNIIANDKSNCVYKKDYLYDYYPFIFKLINNISIYFNRDWIESCFIFKNSLLKLPTCEYDKCNEFVSFSNTAKHYNLYCDKHSTCSISSLEKEIVEFIHFVYKKEIIENYRKLGKELDIFLPDINLGIEFNGLYWHSDKFKDKNYHYDKWKYYNEKGIKIITIWEDDWNLKQNLVKSILLNQLSLNENKIYARKTIIKEVDYKDSKYFLEKNHIQGNCQASIRLGLYYNNELVSLMTFGKRNIGKKLQFELLRFCNKQNTGVVGGASKLFKHFNNQFKPTKVISYANLDISNGKLYDILRFENKGHTGLNYWWVKDKRYSRNKFMKHKLVAEGANPKKTEDEIMSERGYNKIYGSGNIKYTYEV